MEDNMEEILDVLEIGMTDAEALQYAIDVIEFQQNESFYLYGKDSEPELDMCLGVLTLMLREEISDDDIKIL